MIISIVSMKARLVHLPARVLGQLLGASLAALTILQVSPRLDCDDLDHSSLSLLLTPPPPSLDLYTHILHFTLASLLLALLVCAARGFPIYQARTGLFVTKLSSGIS